MVAVSSTLVQSSCLIGDVVVVVVEECCSRCSFEELSRVVRCQWILVRNELDDSDFGSLLDKN